VQFAVKGMPLRILATGHCNILCRMQLMGGPLKMASKCTRSWSHRIFLIVFTNQLTSQPAKQPTNLLTAWSRALI